jgi:hypothetical protein
MRKSMNVLWILALAICSQVSAIPTNAKSAMSEASSAGQFLFLTFYQAKDASFTALSSTVTAFSKSSTNKIAVFNAEAGNPANKETLDKFGIQAGQLPLLLVIAPNGVVTGGHPSTVTAEQLKQGITISDLMLKVLKSLQDQKVALVALQNSATKLNAESWAGVNTFANDTSYKNLVTAIKADPSVAGNQDFIKQCQLITPLSEATVVVLLPPGRIGKIFTGKTTKEEILKALQTCSAGSGCAPGGCSDFRFKQNITPIASALEKVTQLQGVTFTWNTKAYPRRFFTEEPQVGFIAQDVEPIIPEVVHTDSDGFKSISYDKLTAVLVEAVKEMKQQINTQDSIIKMQGAQIKAIEAKQ